MNAITKNFIFSIILTILIFVEQALLFGQNSYPKQYNQLWTTPGNISSNSIPLGNGDVGMNLWMNTNGEILFYISKNDAWSDCGRLLKLGQIRLSFEPRIYNTGDVFSHELKIDEGKSVIKVVNPSVSSEIEIWVDANHPIIHIKSEHTSEVKMNISIEKLKYTTNSIPEDDLHSAYGVINNPSLAEESEDVIYYNNDIESWYHQNKKSIYNASLQLQGLSDYIDPDKDILKNHTFGCAIKGLEATAHNKLTTISKPNHEIEIFVHSNKTTSHNEWDEQINSLINKYNKTTYEELEAAHLNWWSNYWEKSYIILKGDSEAHKVAEGYALQRYLNACGGRGKYPIKFNGSIFTFDYEEHNANYRMWGGATIWGYNTSLIYWNMLNSGDFEMMNSYFNLYMSNLEIAKARTKIFFNHNGAYFPETMHLWGVYAGDNYGWDRTGKQPADVDNDYIRYLYQSGLEVLAMMLDYYDYTRKQSFLSDTIVPYAKEILTFYNEHYSLNNEGKLIISPAQVIETYMTAVNPLPVIAGLKWNIQQLLLYTNNIPPELTALCEQLRERTPNLPKNKTTLLPADSYTDKKNIQKGELYAVFPYRLIDITKPDIQLAIASYNPYENKKRNKEYYYHGEKMDFSTSKRSKDDFGWMLNSLNAAFLGLTDYAKKFLVERFSSPDVRFPIFWKHDWIPSQNHASNAMTTIQKMIVQNVDDKILLLPTFPPEWEVNFKLHTSDNTIIYGEYKNNKIICETYPKERYDDIILMHENTELLYHKTPVSKINISSITGSKTIDQFRGSLQLQTEIIPSEVFDKQVIWSVENITGEAKVNPNGLVSALKNGSVKITATAVDGSDVKATFDMEITNQEVVLSEDIHLQTDSTTFFEGETYHLKAEIFPTDATNQEIQWSIENITGEAEINQDGHISALKNGFVKITATAIDGSDVKATFVVEIIKQEVIPIEIIHLQTDSTTVFVDETYQLNTEIFPTNATNQSIHWSVENLTGEAEISNRGILTTVKTGVVKVMVVSVENTKISDTIQIIIDKPVSHIKMTTKDNIYTMNIHETLQLNTEVLPFDASNKSLTWHITPEHIAILINQGLLYASASGTVNVKATANDNSGVSENITITILDKKPVANKNFELKLYPIPAKNTVYVKIINSPKELYSMELIDLSGRVVLSKKMLMAESINHINIEPYSKGLYYAKFSIGDTIVVKKLLLE